MTTDNFLEYVLHDNGLECHEMPTKEEICKEILGEENEQIDEDNDDDTEFVLPMTTSELKDFVNPRGQDVHGEFERAGSDTDNQLEVTYDGLMYLDL